MTWGPEPVTMKYLEKGPTLMAADRIHGNIGKSFQKTSIVATFDNFVEVCKKANSNIDTITLDLLYIYQISQKSRARSSIKVKMPLLENTTEVPFRKGSRMIYKESFMSELYTAVDVLQSSNIEIGGLTSLLQPVTW